VAHFVKSNVVQLGDLFVTYGLPFVDRASGGSAAGVARALRRLFLELPQDVRVIPGHGSVSGRDDVLAFAAVLEECLDAVSAARGRGYTLAEMTAGKVLGDHARLAGPFVSAEAFLAMLYQEVAAGDEEGTSR
jgi:glyoxylase-like metal-dependent hydrolase (beta-lactamase superfamily II)